MTSVAAQINGRRDEMLLLTERLVEEYSGVVPAGRVMAYVVRCRDGLLQAGVRAGLVPATEAAVRARVRPTLQPDG